MRDPGVFIQWRSYKEGVEVVHLSLPYCPTCNTQERPQDDSFAFSPERSTTERTLEAHAESCQASCRLASWLDQPFEIGRFA